MNRNNKKQIVTNAWKGDLKYVKISYAWILTCLINVVRFKLYPIHKYTMFKASNNNFYVCRNLHKKTRWVMERGKG